jgi:hypothetical protein
MLSGKIVNFGAGRPRSMIGLLACASFLALSSIFANPADALTGTWIEAKVSPADATTYDFGNVTVPDGGLVVVIAQGRATGSRTVSSVSIGGANGTIYESEDAVAGPIAIAGRVVEAGSRNITVTFSDTMARATIGVWVLTDYASEMPSDTEAKYNNSTGSSETITLDFPTNGFAVYGAINNANTAFAWSNAAERDDLTVEGTATRASYADRIAGGNGVVETASWTGSAPHSMIGAVWAPNPRVPAKALYYRRMSGP